jgi:hypothetical protein
MFLCLFFGGRTRRLDPNLFGQCFLIYHNEKNQRIRARFKVNLPPSLCPVYHKLMTGFGDATNVYDCCRLKRCQISGRYCNFFGAICSHNRTTNKRNSTLPHSLRVAILTLNFYASHTHSTHPTQYNVLCVSYGFGLAQVPFKKNRNSLLA